MTAFEIISLLREENIYLKYEDGNLKLAGKTSTISSELLAHVKENKALLIEFLEESKGASKDVEPIGSVETKEHYLLSNAQRRLWVLSQFEGVHI